MPLRTRIIIFTTVGILVLALISAAIIMTSRRNKAPATNNQDTTVNLPVNNDGNGALVKPDIKATVVPVEAKVKPATPAEIADVVIKNLAKVFVERYHTYSSENNYQNIKDVQSIVTNAYWQKISAPISAGGPAPTSFVSLTTEVLSVVSVNVNQAVAEVSLKTRKTSTNNGITSTSYGENLVTFAKVGNNWLISGEEVK